jgi:hypothetical protein
MLEEGKFYQGTGAGNIGPIRGNTISATMELKEVGGKAYAFVDVPLNWVPYYRSIPDKWLVLVYMLLRDKSLVGRRAADLMRSTAKVGGWVIKGSALNGEHTYELARKVGRKAKPVGEGLQVREEPDDVNHNVLELLLGPREPKPGSEEEKVRVEVTIKVYTILAPQAWWLGEQGKKYMANYKKYGPKTEWPEEVLREYIAHGKG